MKKFFSKIRSLKDRIKNNKLIYIISLLIKFIIYAVLIMLLFIIVVQKISSNEFSIGGIKVFTVISGSMKPEYNVGDMLISKDVNPSTLKVGDSVVYRGEKGDMAGLTVTHKIISVREEGGTYYFVTKGNANLIEDPEISSNQILGKIIYKTVIFSFLSRVLLNIYVFYFFCVVVGIIFSYQVIRIMVDDEEVEDNE